MSGKFTPGPWTVEPYAYGRSDCKVIMSSCERVAESVLEANARLIASAPAMHAALEDMLAGWKYIRQHHGDLYGVGWDRCQQSAEAALALSHPLEEKS